MWPKYFAEVFTPPTDVRLLLVLVGSFLPIFTKFFLSPPFSFSAAKQLTRQMRIPADSGGDYLVKPTTRATINLLQRNELQSAVALEVLTAATQKIRKDRRTN